VSYWLPKRFGAAEMQTLDKKMAMTSFDFLLSGRGLESGQASLMAVMRLASMSGGR
jgi:hypothetical protein